MLFRSEEFLNECDALFSDGRQFPSEASPKASRVDDGIKGPRATGKRSPQMDIKTFADESTHIFFCLSVALGSSKAMAIGSEA